MYPSRRFAALAAVTIAALALGACATMHVNAFAVRGVDFAQYRTYSWAPDDQLLTGDPRLDNNQFFLDRLQKDVDEQLAAKGLELTVSTAPALIVHYHASVIQRLNISNADQQYGECNGCGPYVYDAGTLLLDFVDAKSDKLVWRGWAEGAIDGIVDRQELLNETVDKAVARILNKFPRGL